MPLPSGLPPNVKPGRTLPVWVSSPMGLRRIGLEGDGVLGKTQAVSGETTLPEPVTLAYTTAVFESFKKFGAPPACAEL